MSKSTGRIISKNPGEVSVFDLADYVDGARVGIVSPNESTQEGTESNMKRIMYFFGWEISISDFMQKAKERQAAGVEIHMRHPERW